jgi:hypothetical protein
MVLKVSIEAPCCNWCRISITCKCIVVKYCDRGNRLIIKV